MFNEAGMFEDYDSPCKNVSRLNKRIPQTDLIDKRESLTLVFKSLQLGYPIWPSLLFIICHIGHISYFLAV